MAGWKALSLLAFLAAAASSADAQKFKMEELDFTDAEEDPATGQLCITRKYCLANAEELAKRLPQEPCFPPGCNCNADGDCTNGTAPYCADCRCSSFPQGRVASELVIFHSIGMAPSPWTNSLKKLLSAAT